MAVYWVKDTVNADNVGTVNTFGDPFGIQKAFDTATAGDEIRIVTGGNNYNSGSTSWNNRDAADKTINVDTNAGTGTSFIKVSGWSDETTEAMVTLDFDSASIVGSNGFTVTGVADFVIWKNIRVTDTDTDGWDFAGGVSSHVMYLCRGDNNGVYGADSGTNGSPRCIACQFDNNGTDGTALLSSLILCELNNNTSNGQGSSNDFKTHIFCLFDGNLVLGCSQDDNVTYVNCTFEDNADGLNIVSGNLATILVNCAFTNNSSFGIDGTTGVVPLELNCGYFNNGGLTNIAGIEEQIGRVTTNPGYADAGARDYALGTNWKAAGTGGFNSGDSTGYVDIGAVQREEAGGTASGVRNPLGGPV